MEMAKYGAIPNDGVNRQALSPADIAARKALIRWARNREFTIGQDEIGNLFIRRNGNHSNAIPVMTGSHMDSQPCGGTHVGETAEVGEIHIGKIEKKGKENRRFRIRFGPLPD